MAFVGNDSVGCIGAAQVRALTPLASESCCWFCCGRSADGSPSSVTDLMHARYRQPGRLGELLAEAAALEPLADEAGQPSVGGIECAAGVRAD